MVNAELARLVDATEGRGRLLSQGAAAANELLQQLLLLLRDGALARRAAPHEA